MGEPYYADMNVRLYHGDMREVMQDFTEEHWADVVVTDPPYGETSLRWDTWPERWPLLCTWHTTSMWCFGSMRMFTDHWTDFAGWKLSQDVVWEKHNGSGFASDRFKRVHEHALHFYTGTWLDAYHKTPRILGGDGSKSIRTRGTTPHTGRINNAGYMDDGLRLTRSVIKTRSMHGDGLHPTEKPSGILMPLIEYACPPDGLVLDPFAGSGSTAVAAVMSGRRAVLIEADEEHCEKAARRLSQGVLEVADDA